MSEDLDKVMRHHRAAWRVERIGWAVMALALLGALLGAFGDGALSRAHAGSTDTLSVDYDRLLRSSAPTQYRFRVNPGMASQGRLRLRLDRSLVEHMELESIVPEPLQQAAGPAYAEFVFLVEPGNSPVNIDLRYRPATLGRQSGRISIAGEHAVVIEQYVFP